MSDINHRPTPGALERATHALRDAPAPPGPPADLLAATVATVHNRLAGTVPAEVARQQRRRRIMRIVRFGSAATVAAGLLVAAGVLWLGSAPASAAFVKAIENVEKAKSMRAVVVTEAATGMTFEMKMFAQGDAARSEMDMGKDMGSFVVIVDAKKREMVQLFPKTKTAIRTDLAEVEKKTEAVAKDVGKLTGLLTDLKGAKVAALPDETVDGRKLKVFTVNGHKLEELKGTADVTVWIDPKTELPARYRMDMRIGDVKTTATTTFLGFNEDLDPKLFDTTLPAGYKLQEAKPDAPKPAPEAKPGAESADGGETVFIAVRTAAENAEKAKSYRMVAYFIESGVRTEWQTITVQSNVLRVDMPREKEVRVIDVTRRRELTVDIPAKTARLMHLTEAEAAAHRRDATEPVRLLALFREQKEFAVRELPRETAGGLPARVYEVRRAGGDEAVVGKVWIDARSDLPIRFRGPAADPSRPAGTEIVLEFDRWNEDFDTKLFDQTPPDGYTVTELKGDAKKDGK